MDDRQEIDDGLERDADAGLSWYSLHVIGRLGGARESNTARTINLVGTVRLGLREMVEQAKFAQLTYVVNHIQRLEGVKGSSNGIGCPVCHTMDGFENNGRELTPVAARVHEQIGALRPSIQGPGQGSRSMRSRPGWLPGSRCTRSF